MAERIQRRRTKGWRMPEGAVYVGAAQPLGQPVHRPAWHGVRPIRWPQLRRSDRGVFGTGYLWRRSDGEELVLDPTEVSVFLPVGQTTPVERLRTDARHVVDLFDSGNVLGTIAAIPGLREAPDGGT